VGHVIRATLIFIKEKSELHRFVLDCEMSSLLFGMNILEKLDHYSVFRVSRMLSFDQWLQNALNTSDNSSIYNY